MNKQNVPESSPVSVVIIGAEDFDKSLDFYTTMLGLEILDQQDCKGPEFEQHWNLPGGAAARTAVLGHGADPIGRIQIMEFNASDRQRTRERELQRAHGLLNLNIYSSDIHADYEGSRLFKIYQAGKQGGQCGGDPGAG